MTSCDARTVSSTPLIDTDHPQATATLCSSLLALGPQANALCIEGISLPLELYLELQ